MFANAVLIG